MRAADRPVQAIERATALDAPAGVARDLVHRVVSNRRVKDALHGVWLGHPLHPALAQIALGSFTSASLIDLVGGSQRESSRLIATGLLAAAPTAAAGWADFSEGQEEQQRVGLVHAAMNVAALSCFAGALARRRGGRRGGRILSLTGGGLGGLSAALGGHLSFRLASGANHAQEIQHVGPENWQPVAPVAELPTDRPVRRLIGDVPVLVLRHRGIGPGPDSGTDSVAETVTETEHARVTVMSDRCPHLSAPLNEGELSTVEGELCITCPWHASVFRISDGEVVHGPATAPVPRFESRVTDGMVQARVLTLPGVQAS